MASLESLANPLERIAVLPDAMNFRKNPQTGLPYWDATIQYFINDVVISPITEGAYICSGGASNQTAVLGGSDPSADTTGVWWSTSVQGVSNAASLTPTYTSPVGVGAYTVTNGTLAAPAGSSWLVTVQCVAATPNPPAPLAFSDIVTFTATPNGGAGAVTATINLNPNIGAASTVDWSGSGFVTVGAGGTQIVLGGSCAGSVLDLGAVRATFVRLA